MQLNDAFKNLLLLRMQLGDVARHLFLAGNELGGEMVDTLPHQGEIGRHRFELLPIRRRRVGRGLRRQPLKLRIRARYHLSDSVALRLPGQGGGDTDAKCDQETGDGARDSLAEWQPLAQEPVNLLSVLAQQTIVV